MNATPSTVLTLPSRLQPLALLAMLLERMDNQVRPAEAAQYRALAAQMSRLLADTAADEDLNRLLAAFPATAAVYENLRYEHAGLCRSPLERSLNSELAATALIDRMRARPPLA